MMNEIKMNAVKKEIAKKININIDKELVSTHTWKTYLWIAIKFLFIFYIATLCIAVFFVSHGIESILLSVIMGASYLFIVIVSLRKMVKQLPMAAIFLAAPIIPLFMLFIVLSLIPILHWVA